MRRIDLAGIKSLMVQEGAMISFSGPFSHSIIEELGKAVRQYLESEEISRSSVMDVFSVFVEQSQNVRNYTVGNGGEGDPRASSGIVVIGKQGEHYVISSGNLIANQDAAPLRATLEQLKGLDKGELKALYKERLRAPGNGKGAGLGLIEIARRAAEPIGYEFQPVDDHFYFFSLLVAV